MFGEGPLLLPDHGTGSPGLQCLEGGKEGQCVCVTGPLAELQNDACCYHG